MLNIIKIIYMIYIIYVICTCSVIIGDFKMADNELGVVRLGMPGM